MKVIMKFITLLLILFYLETDTVSAQVEMPTVGLCAHRGAMTTYPENTLPAFLEAIYRGAQMIEFDLQLTKDSVLVIMHDPTVNRTTNGKGLVSEMTLAEVRQLDAGSQRGKNLPPVKVPTFEETLVIMPRNIWLNCHLKGGIAAARKATEIIVKEQRLHQAFLACDASAAIAARETNKLILICNMEPSVRNNNDKYVQATIKGKAAFIQFSSGNGLPPQALIDKLKDHKIRINYFHAKDTSELAHLFSLGINFPLVNDIDSFMPVAQNSGIVPVRPEF